MSAAQPLPMSPGAILWVGIDWSRWLGSAGIASQVVSVPTGITELDEEVSGTVTRARVQLDPAAATDGSVTLEVAFSVTTNEAKPQTDTRYFVIRPQHRTV